MAPLQQSTVRNRLLKRLSEGDFALLASHLQPMTTQLKQGLIAPHTPIKQLFFPEVGFTSVVTAGPHGRIEVGLIGREGLVGASPVLLGSDRSPHECFIQNAGEMLCIDTDALCAAVRESASLHKLLLRSIQVQIIQTAQTAYVNGALQIEGRLARWLLMCHDRVDGDELVLTHEFLSIMLGVQRSSVTLTLQSLEGSRLIRARRGRISVLDRKQLEVVADDGYGVAEVEHARLIEGA